MRSFSKQLLFLLVIVAIFATGVLIIKGATPQGKLKINPDLTAKVKMVKQENATTTSNNPVGWWKFDETTAIHGSTLADSSGNGNTGTLSTGDGATNKSVAGKLGKGLSFDGVNDYVDAGTSSAFDITNAFTVGAWVKFNNFSTYRTIAAKWSTSHGWYLAVSTTGKVDFAQGALDHYFGVQTLSPNTWYHILATYDGVSIGKVYVNGVLDQTINPYTASVSSNPLGLGRTTNLFYMNGIIDDVRIYNRALSASEVAQMYNSTKDGYLGNVKVSTGLVGYWKLDDNNALTSVIDYSGKGNTGTAYSGTATSTSALSTTTAMIGRAMSFDGVNDYIDVGNGASLDITKEITLAGWVKINSIAGHQALISKNEIYSLYVGANDGSIDAQLNINGIKSNRTVSGTFSAGVWTHVVTTYKSGDWRIYKNGALLVTRTAYTGAISSSPATNVRIGNNELSYILGGQIDEVKIWNYARSAEQIKQDYERGLKSLP